MDIRETDQQDSTYPTSLKPILRQSLNKIIHTEPRLKIILALLHHTSLVFTELQEIVGLTPGNLGRHCNKLAEVGYVFKSKKVIDDKFLTVYEITAEGLQAFKQYKDLLESHIQLN